MTTGELTTATTRLGPHMVVAQQHLPATVFQVGGVTLHPDRRVELADDVDLDHAAHDFWAAVQRAAGWDR